jgi:type IV pilus assembly protein PilO
MLPFARIAREWRRVLVPLAALAVVDIAVYGFVVYPMTLSAAGAARRAETARQTRAAAQEEHALAQAVVNSRSVAASSLQRFYAQVLPANLPAVRRMTYARLAELARETNLLYDRRSFEEDTGYRGSLKRLQITMDLEGNYADIREFIYLLESAPEFVIIEDLSLSSGTEEDAPLALTLRLATYYREENEQHGG